MTAFPIVSNKFWIVERGGVKYATIQSAPDGVVFVQQNERVKFPSIKMLKDTYRIEFTKAKKDKKQPATVFSVNNYPCEHKPFNILYDASRKLPVYTKTEKSKCFFCAGHYAIKFNQTYVPAYCPKLITLTRYEHVGPFKSKEELKTRLQSM